MSRVEDRAVEISAFLEVPYDDVLERLSAGFHHNHALVAEDFNSFGADVDDEKSLLDWYRSTDAYIYELTAYHVEEGFNYSGMCDGIAQHLSTAGKPDVLTLGDGIGDLTIRLAKEGLNPTYHDLAGSLTWKFADYRFHIVDVRCHYMLTASFAPNLMGEYDAVVALDFLEHVVNVSAWVERVHEVLRPGGVFLAQNAFGIGDMEHGNSIPMHLAVNNKYVDEWVSLVDEVGFDSPGNGWLVKR